MLGAECFIADNGNALGFGLVGLDCLCLGFARCGEGGGMAGEHYFSKSVSKECEV